MIVECFKTSQQFVRKLFIQLSVARGSTVREGWHCDLATLNAINYQFEAEDQASLYTSHPNDAPLASTFPITQE